MFEPLYSPIPTPPHIPNQLSRDEIAVQVLNGLYSNPSINPLLKGYSKLTEIAYAQADAMIAERDKPDTVINIKPEDIGSCKS